MTGSYNHALVALAFAVAAIASYIALFIAARLRAARGMARAYWLTGGACAMGAGIWSTHFIGMLALRLPVPLAYDGTLTLASLALAVIASLFALATVAAPTISALRLAGSSLLLGAGIAAMHFVGMLALRMAPPITWDPGWLTLSALLAVAAASVALWIAFRLRAANAGHLEAKRIASALIMAAAIVGMHFAGMHAARFAPDAVSLAATRELDDHWLAAVIAACVALLIPAMLLLRGAHSGRHDTDWHAARIRTRISLAFFAVSALVAVFAVVTAWIQTGVAGRAAEVQARDIGQLLIAQFGADPLGRPGVLQSALQTMHQIDGRDAFVIDARRIIVADSNRDEIGATYRDGGAWLDQVLAEGRPDAFVESQDGNEAGAMLFALPLHRLPGNAASPIDGALVMEYTRIATSLAAGTRPLTVTVAAIGAILILAISLLGLRLAASVSGPLVELQRGVAAIAGGNYDVRVRIRGGDELGDLGTAFNRMGEDLARAREEIRQHQLQLEENVASRTAAAEQALAAHQASAASLKLIADRMPAMMSRLGSELQQLPAARRAGTVGTLGTAGIAGVMGPRSLDPTPGSDRSEAAPSPDRLSALPAPLPPTLPAALPTALPPALTPALGPEESASIARALLESNAALRKINEQLEEAQHQLLQSEKMASVGQLAAGVAHEINNPLGYVHSNLGTLDGYLVSLLQLVDRYQAAEAQIANPALRAELATARRDVDLDFLRTDVLALTSESKEGITRVKKIVHDLKNFSHADEADEWQWADLHAGIDSTLNVAWNELKYKCEVNKEYGALPRVLCLPSQLNQVFMNLLVNAAQAIRERGTITIRTGLTGDEVWLQFADTGGGIAPENVGRIFDPFFTTKPVGKGTGLGLSLSYGIVQKHRGRIEVESEIGHGAAFTIWLPVGGQSTRAAGAPMAGLAGAAS